MQEITLIPNRPQNVVLLCGSISAGKKDFSLLPLFCRLDQQKIGIQAVGNPV